MASRDELIRLARIYLYDGLVRQDIEAVRRVLSDDCTRVEQGRNTGTSGGEIAEMFGKGVFDMITGVSNERWLVEGDEGVVFYDLALGERPKVLIAERFRVSAGKVCEIEALFYATQAADG